MEINCTRYLDNATLTMCWFRITRMCRACEKVYARSYHYKQCRPDCSQEQPINTYPWKVASPEIVFWGFGLKCLPPQKLATPDAHGTVLRQPEPPVCTDCNLGADSCEWDPVKQWCYVCHEDRGRKDIKKQCELSLTKRDCGSEPVLFKNEKSIVDTSYGLEQGICDECEIYNRHCKIAVHNDGFRGCCTECWTRGEQKQNSCNLLHQSQRAEFLHPDNKITKLVNLTADRL